MHNMSMSPCLRVHMFNLGVLLIRLYEVCARVLDCAYIYACSVHTSVCVCVCLSAG